MRSNNRGFTLIEIMIAMLLLSFLMISVIMMTNNSFDVKDRTLVQDENNLKIYAALQRIEWDISHAYSPLYYEKIMEPQDLAIKKTVPSSPNSNEEQPETDPSLQASTQIFETLKQRISSNRNFKELSITALPVPNFELKSKDDFIFFTIGNRRKFSDSKESFYAWVRYRLEDQENEEDAPAELQGLKRLVRYFIPQDPFSLAEIDYDKVKPFTLMRNIKALKFEFWSNKNEKFVDNLKESAEPFVFRAVKVTITWLDDFSAEQEIEHIITPLYPFFDLELDKKEREQVNPNTSTATNNNSGNDNNNDGNNSTSGTNGGSTTGSNGGTP